MARRTSSGERLAEALRAFKKIYLEMVDRIVDHLEAQEPAKSVE